MKNSNNKSILKTREKFNSEKYNVFTEVIDKVASSWNDDKRMQSIYLIKTCICIWNEQRSSKWKRSDSMKQYNKTMLRMINFNNVTNKSIKEHNPNWPQIPDHPCWILVFGGSGLGETNSLFNLTNQQPDTDKISLYAKQKRNYSFIWMIFIKKNEEYSPNKKCKILIAFDDMIADMFRIKNLIQQYMKYLSGVES